MKESLELVQQACKAVGWGTVDAEPIRIAENAIWRLPGGVVARVTPDPVVARRELCIARWFAEQEVPAVRPMDGLDVIVIDGRAISFWRELPPHKMGDCMNMAALLRQVHALPTPDFLQPIEPFEALARRAAVVKCIAGAEREWLFAYIEELRAAWRSLPDGLPWCVVHGDAWSGNCAVTADGKASLLDFDLVSVGPPEWDLTAIAVALSVGGKLTPQAYQRFCEAYGGVDVTEWDGYSTTRAIRELIMTTWSASVADVRPEWREEVRYRVECLRGKKGPRPWQWTAIH